MFRYELSKSKTCKTNLRNTYVPFPTNRHISAYPVEKQLLSLTINKLITVFVNRAGNYV